MFIFDEAQHLKETGRGFTLESVIALLDYLSRETDHKIVLISAPAAAAHAEWLAGLYLTLDYRLARRRELSQHAVYLLFARERGVRAEHAEFLICRDAGEATQAMKAVGPGLWHAGLPRLTRILVLDHHDSADSPPNLPAGCEVVTYARFMDLFVDVDRHLADLSALYPPLTAATIPVPGDLLGTDARTGEMTITATGNARDLTAQLAAVGGNLLVIGPPGSGKTTLLKQLMVTPSAAGARRTPHRTTDTAPGRSEKDRPRGNSRMGRKPGPGHLRTRSHQRRSHRQIRRRAL